MSTRILIVVPMKTMSLKYQKRPKNKPIHAKILTEEIPAGLKAKHQTATATSNASLQETAAMIIKTYARRVGLHTMTSRANLPPLLQAITREAAKAPAGQSRKMETAIAMQNAQSLETAAVTTKVHVQRLRIIIHLSLLTLHLQHKQPDQQAAKAHATASQATAIASATRPV